MRYQAQCRELFGTVGALRYFAALRGDHPTITMTVPVTPSTVDNQAVLVLDDGSQPVLDALAGREALDDSGGSPPPANGRANPPTAC
jgi:hypothetical protein